MIEELDWCAKCKHREKDIIEDPCFYCFGEDTNSVYCPPPKFEEEEKCKSTE